MRLKNIKLLIATFMFAVLSMTAQEIKFGHINTDVLLSIMPETKKAEKEMKNLGETYENELKSMISEYQNKAQKYQAEAEKKSNAINQSRMKEMQDMEARIQQYRSTVQQDTQKKKV